MLLLLTGIGRVDPGLLRCDVAGVPFAHAPTASLRDGEAARTHVADGGAPLSAEAREAARTGGVLVADADAWFPAAAAARLLAAARRAESPLRVASPHGGTLAVHLPPAHAAAVLGEGDGALPATAGDVAPPEGEWTEVEVGEGAEAARRVRTMLDLAECETALLRERARAAARAGVRIRDLDRVAIRGELHCGAGVEIDVGVVIQGTVRLGDGVRIGAHAIVIDSTLDAGCDVRPYSLVENATVGAGTFVGPYGRLRPGSVIGERVQIGNFVEVKSSRIGPGSRINHLAFVGDSTLGRNVTLGAATITCNHGHGGVARTVIGDGAYVGSGTQLVAPVEIGENATIGAGSTVTRDAPAGELTLARARQVTVPGWRPPGAGEPK
jgi:acetyltransferase-like isoleucine patch superfamily enzyme